MSRSNVTADELYSEIVKEVGDPGGVDIIVLRSEGVGWFAEVRKGSEPLPESGFQTAVDEIVARLRSRYDLCPFSGIPPMLAEGGRNHARMVPPGIVRDRLWHYWKDKGVTEVAPLFDIYKSTIG